MSNVFLFLVIIGLIIVLVALFILDRVLKSKIKHTTTRHVSIWLIKLKKIKNSGVDNANKLSKIDALFKNYIKEKENISEDKEYSELMDYFKSKKNTKLFEISQELLEAYYEKEDLSSSNLDKIISLLENELK